MSHEDELVDWTNFAEASAAATSTLTVATTTATATELPRVAEASREVQQVLININVAGSFDRVPQTVLEDLQAKAQILKEELSKVEGPTTHTFQCDKEFQDRMRNATSLAQRIGYCVLFVICLLEGFVPLSR